MQMFVVRVMEPSGDDTMRGVVRRVSDGAEQPFHGSDQLLSLLGRSAGRAEGEEPGP